MSAVESILTLDKLRQSVAVKERLLAQGGSNTSYQNVSMRKTASVPNFSQVSIMHEFVRNIDCHQIIRVKQELKKTVECKDFNFGNVAS